MICFKAVTILQRDLWPDTKIVMFSIFFCNVLIISF